MTYVINNLLLVLIGLGATAAIGVGGWAIRLAIMNGNSISAINTVIEGKADAARVAVVEQKTKGTEHALTEIRDDLKYVRGRVDTISDRLANQV